VGLRVRLKVGGVHGGISSVTWDSCPVFIHRNAMTLLCAFVLLLVLNEMVLVLERPTSQAYQSCITVSRQGGVRDEIWSAAHFSPVPLVRYRAVCPDAP